MMIKKKFWHQEIYQNTKGATWATNHLLDVVTLLAAFIQAGTALSLFDSYIQAYPYPGTRPVV